MLRTPSLRFKEAGPKTGEKCWIVGVHFSNPFSGRASCENALHFRGLEKLSFSQIATETDSVFAKSNVAKGWC